MGFFTRFQRNNNPANAGTTDTATQHTAGGGRSSRGPLVMNMSTRPSFGQWLKVTWLDLATMVVMGVIGLGVSDTMLCCLRLI
jgi:diacylglycerol diphosphate phosphatase/phosphatidate phosphatase